MHWCQDETTAVITFFSGLPLAWRWFRAGAARWWKLMLKSKLRPDQHNVIASEYFRPKSNNLTGDCPVSICNIKGPHSHTEALMRRVKEK